MQTVRTTIRIRKELLDQSKLLALRNNTSLQQVINDTLASGFGHITDFDVHKQAIAKIDKFRKSIKGKKINVEKLVKDNKKEFEERTNRLLNFK